MDCWSGDWIRTSDPPSSAVRHVRERLQDTFHTSTGAFGGQHPGIHCETEPREESRGRLTVLGIRFALGAKDSRIESPQRSVDREAQREDPGPTAMTPVTE